MAHKPEWQIIEEIGQWAAQIAVGANYVHYKDATKTYTVKEFVVLEDTDEIGVLYQANYHANLFFVRPCKEWVELVNGSPRFQKA